jgi:hypothetical protein
MTRAKDNYDNRPWVKPAVMPTGHYDLDDCGGVHDISHISTPADMRAARDAFEQARRPRGKAQAKSETETGAYPGRWHKGLCFAQFGVFHAFDGAKAKYSSTPTTPIYADAETLCGLSLHILGATVRKAELDPVAVHPTPICAGCLRAIMDAGEA